MLKRTSQAVLIAALLVFISTVPGCAERGGTPAVVEKNGPIKVYSYERKGFVMSEKIVRSEAEWKKHLTPEQFRIMREKGTEQAGTGKYAHNREQGIYRCAGCGLDLFRSEDKYDSGTGWPSFFAPVSPDNITTAADNSLFSRRTEVLCRRCGGHLGHVFDDGPKPTGLRYCLNSAALEFAAAVE
ncbi:MAG: peptide-methionine (R)-S-oxide reductase MsrB [Desulfuromonadaceae bacterium]|nr:peptide-methionine (R)-S-oxide reductase MsrB [Desulfuromonadaceae bacterium]